MATVGFDEVFDEEYSRLVALGVAMCLDRKPHVEPSGAAPGRQAPWLPAAAAVVAVVAGGIAIGACDEEPTVRTGAPETSVPAAAAPTSPAVTSGSTGPATTPSPTTTAAADPAVPRTIGVDAADPPPLVVPVPFVSIPLEPNPNGNAISVAIGADVVAVSQPESGYVTLVDAAPGRAGRGSARTVDLAEQLHSIVIGPGDVLYGFGDVDPPEHQGVPDAFRYVAIALSGERVGDVVASSELAPIRYLELPAGAFGHGPAGIVDRGRDVNRTVTGYVDANGEPASWQGPAPMLLRSEGDDERRLISVDGDDLAWELVIAKSPDHGGDYVGPSPPAPTSGGRAIYTDTIGPDLTPDQDFGPNQMPVVALLEPDGSGHWVRLPDDWAVAASDVWGTVLMRTVGDAIELAFLDDAGPSS